MEYLEDIDRQIELINAELETADPNSCEDLKEKITNIQIKLNQKVEEISKYDVERYSHTINKLTTKLYSRNNTNNSTLNKPKKFQFNRNRNKDAIQTEIQDSSDKVFNEANNTNILARQTIRMDNKLATVSNLEYCTIMVDSNYSKKPTGSITFSNIKKSIIYSRDILFESGSIFFNDCKECIILLELSSKNRTQLRLHNLIGCKIYFKSNDKQTIIIEDCKNCVFHNDTEGHLDVKDFNNLGLSIDDLAFKNYDFEEFEIENWDIEKLKKRYIIQ
ncbi:hypothetical protein TBLA_0G01580 [Henningerozyma blattae CBS 6284]|uniref:C-CAP/cofactor C-like domain-containing protein n=1 Tax=Henningerozyma blattae (strain ATCC 34711 / CBS 6284 / DSM 70876 / NBRC 10599 / NRRL Y-10934 / UCD 77-7) TaxID=1071380 RepID=I2H6V0_HENB6|nr:hypothetical protein TBLA_0G01580 [Tetrapisispora blattae CBS 6284]CCH62102.1 hypothetical protein TBLA_0G01580 [Tetrapisispora blattae CBS 6284]